MKELRIVWWSNAHLMLRFLYLVKKKNGNEGDGNLECKILHKFCFVYVYREYRPSLLTIMAELFLLFFLQHNNSCLSAGLNAERCNKFSTQKKKKT